MMAYGTSVSGKGLVGNDGAAVAGSIKRRIDLLDKYKRACIIARYSMRTDTCPCCGGDKPMDEYRESILLLVDWAQQFVSQDSSVHRILYAIVQEFFERRRQLLKVADSLKVPKRTAYDQKDKIWPHLSELSKQAESYMDDALADICETSEEAA
jgi:RNA polymerase subunit RPABC4/transcription elongation factor Spt4